MAGQGPLGQIEHIVVLMQENRSFDQMLGYLMRDGMPDVEGLTGNESNPDPDGVEHFVSPFELNPDGSPVAGEATVKELDPCHSPTCVGEQLADGNKGFVKNFVATRGGPLAPELHDLPMRYYTGQHLPVYDHLARQFCVCDAWHSSVPGDTWPNRLFSLTGQATEPIGHDAPFYEQLKHLPFLNKLLNAPIFELEAFTHHLADEQWRWYSHDPATLRAADERYRDPGNFMEDNFAFFDRRKVSDLTKVLEEPMVGGDSFLDDVANGQLRQLSWIDPNFVDLSILDPNSNDDHPPSDVRSGQQLVLDVYQALVESKNWENTLLVVVYDEHGGFHDHVVPPPVDDDSGYKTLGVRVPALVVGPRVRNTVCKEIFEHTALIRTIFRCLAKDPEQALAAMGGRIADPEGPDLGVVLDDKPRKDVLQAAQVFGNLAKDNVVPTMEQWQALARSRRLPAAKAASRAFDGAGHPLELHDFQRDHVKFSLAMRGIGLPPGQP